MITCTLFEVTPRNKIIYSMQNRLWLTAQYKYQSTLDLTNHDSETGVFSDHIPSV